MEKLDELAVESGLDIRQMMELAGWHMVSLVKAFDISISQHIVIVCGKGNKGGDGLSAARHLSNYGFHVSVVLASSELKPDPAHHLGLLKKMEIDILTYDDKDKVKELLGSADVLIDALLGYHLDGAPRGDFAELILLMNGAEAKVVSYDLPSGVDATSGECLSPCILAQATLTLALPKKLFETESGKKASGDVYLADIGISGFLYDQIEPGSRPAFGPIGLVKL